MSGRYDITVLSGSTYERAAKMVERHAGPGLVIDLGCSYGNVAEVFAAAGRHYVGVDVDADALASLAERGHECHVLDLTAEDLGHRLRTIVGDRAVGAVLALDVIEHLPDPATLLGQLSRLSEEWGDPLLVTSVPNVAHTDLAAKLLGGRWDLTDLGLLDRTHLSLFTEGRMHDELAAHGFVCVDADDVVCDATDQHFPAQHPYLARGTPLWDLLSWLRSLPDDTGGTYQFVRALRHSAAAISAAPSDATASPELTVLVAGRGQRPVIEGLEDTLVCLAAQDTAAFEVIVPVPSDELDAVQALVGGFAPDVAGRVRVVGSGHPRSAGRLNAALEQVRSPLVAFVASGDVLTPDWARRFVEAAAERPGVVLRARCFRRQVEPVDGSVLSQTKAVPVGEERFELWRHLRADQLPLGSFALPAALCRHAGLRFDENATAATWKFSLTAAMLAGVVDVPAATCVQQRRGDDGDEPDGLELVAALVGTPLFFPAGTAGVLHGAGCEQDWAVALSRELEETKARLEVAERRADEVERLYQEIRTSEWWRASAPIRRGLSWVKTRRPRTP